MRKIGEVFLPAVGAGLGIALGGTVYLSVENRIAGALLFTVGLYMIVLNGLNLYTGKVGYLVEKPAGYLVDLLLIWIGNLVGTWLGAQAILHTRINGIAGKALELSMVKLEDGAVSLFLLAVFCGILMFVAVDGYKETKKPAILFVCVSVFILAGFEHCIANMFYFSLAGVWSIQTLAKLLVMTLGNSVGGMLIPLLKKNLKK